MGATMTEITKHKYSNPKVWQSLKTMGLNQNLSIDHHINYAQTKFDNPIVDLSCSREVFKFLVTKTIPVSEVKECYEEDYNDQSIRDYADDVAYDMRKECDLSMLKIDTDSSKVLYLEPRAHTFEHYVIGETILIRSVVSFYLCGDDYNSLFKDFDVSRFITRHYDHEPIEIMLENDRCVSDYSAFIPAFSEEHYYHDGKIDGRLMASYMHHQLLSLIFKVTYDPFFEKDGLIHQKGKGFGERAQNTSCLTILWTCSRP